MAIFASIAASELVSLVVAIKVLRSKRHFAEKAALCLVLAVPFAGPVLYLFLVDDTPVQDPALKNRLPWGWYTQREISNPYFSPKLLALLGEISGSRAKRDSSEADNDEKKE